MGKGGELTWQMEAKRAVGKRRRRRWGKGPAPPLYRQWGHLLVQTISIRYSPAPPLIAAARLAALLQITRYSTRWRIDSR